MDRLLLIVNAIFTLIFAVLVVVLLFDVSKIDTHTGSMPAGQAISETVTTMPLLRDRLERLEASAATLQKQVDNFAAQLQGASQSLSDLTRTAASSRSADRQAVRDLLQSTAQDIARSKTTQANLTQQTAQLHQAVAVLESRINHLTLNTGVADIAGDWVLQLPDGDTHDAVLFDMGNDRYELQTKAPHLGGVYRLDGQRLVMVRPHDRQMMDFAWTFRNESTLDLTREPKGDLLDTSCLGATLTRP